LIFSVFYFKGGIKGGTLKFSLS